MSEGGMEGAADLIQDKFGVASKRPRFTDQGKQANDHRIGANFNSSAARLNKLQPTKSVETIYKDAVPKQVSSSSEDDNINTSDEMELSHMIDHFLVTERSVQADEPIQDDDQEYEPTPQERADNLVKEAERAKAKIFNTPGKQFQNVNMNKQFVHSMMVDESYMVVGGHLDETTYAKIVAGEYVDFARLIAKDRLVQHEEEDRLELVYKEVKAFWVPSRGNGVVINSFSKWEQAFWVFSNIYTKQHPHRASKLIEYNHIIHTISMQYTWNNIYAYDKDFQLHMARNPDRSWAIILQQAWNMRLVDKIGRSEGAYAANQGSNIGHSGEGGSKVSELCHKFNRGKCTHGANCKYEHRCSYSFKFGHQILVCRKASADKARGETRTPLRKGGDKDTPVKRGTNNLD